MDKEFWIHALVDLKDNWIAEKDGVNLWPPVSYLEIAEWMLGEGPCASVPSSSKRKHAESRQKGQ